MSSTPPQLKGLYAVTPDIDDTSLLLSKVTVALENGTRWLQYRNKTASQAVCLSQASQLSALCRRYDAHLIINDDIALALAIDADGLHLGKDDLDPTLARKSLGTHKILGISCYNDLDRARRVAINADYIAFGSVFTSTTKPGLTRAPLEIFNQAKSELKLPVAAIGGITLDNASKVIDAGADLLAVISDLFESSDICTQVKAYNELFQLRTSL